MSEGYEVPPSDSDFTIEYRRWPDGRITDFRLVFGREISRETAEVRSDAFDFRSDAFDCRSDAFDCNADSTNSSPLLPDSSANAADSSICKLFVSLGTCLAIDLYGRNEGQ